MNELHRFIAAKHFAGTEDEVTDVVTSPFKAGLRAVDHVAVRRYLACFSGVPGTGKTLTALTACARLTVTPFYVPIARSSSGKDVEYQILRRVDPVLADYRRPRWAMRQDIVAGLAKQPSLLVLDEFDVMESAGADVLRFLLEQKVAGYLVVGSKADRVLCRYPALESRCARWVAFSPLDRKTLVETLHAYHPLFAATKAEVLLRVDEEWAKGIFRDWAKLLEVALRLPAREREGGLALEAIGKCYLLIGRPTDRAV